MNPLIIAALISASAAGFAAWQVQSWRYDARRNTVLKNKPLMTLLRSASSALWKIAAKPLAAAARSRSSGDAALIYGALLTAVVLLLSGCHTPPIKPCERPAPVTMPALSEPLPPVNYSLSVQRNIEAWEKRLRATSATSKP